MSYDENKKYKLYKDNKYKCKVNILELNFLFNIDLTNDINAINDFLKAFNYKVV
jgi:hypothetical protein